MFKDSLDKVARNFLAMRWPMVAEEAKLRAALELADVLSHWCRSKRGTATVPSTRRKVMRTRGGKKLPARLAQGGGHCVSRLFEISE